MVARIKHQVTDGSGNVIGTHDDPRDANQQAHDMAVTDGDYRNGNMVTAVVVDDDGNLIS